VRGNALTDLPAGHPTYRVDRGGFIVVKADYAKWMLDDPRVNFAISTRGRVVGLDHLGIQVKEKAELNEVYARLHRAGGTVIEQGQTSCC
jgi:hypothetical protein